MIKLVKVLHCSIWCNSIKNFTGDVGDVIMNKVSEIKKVYIFYRLKRKQAIMKDK